VINFAELTRRFQLEKTETKSGRVVVRGEFGEIWDLCGEPVAVIRLGDANEMVRKLAFKAVRPNGIQNLDARLRKGSDKIKTERVREITRMVAEHEDAEFRD
jgi:hypothetical protein